MTRQTVVVCCDGCLEQKGPTFCSEYHAEDWIEDRDEDYAEYGQFVDFTPRRSELFHKIGRKVYCARCTEIEIQRLKKQNDRLEKVLEQTK